MKNQWLIIGHRGVGKTSFTNNLKENSSFSDISFYCLDEEIEKSTQKTIKDIFSENGESHFRDLEIQVLDQLLCENEKCIVALGAGFIGVKPVDTKSLWLSRPTNPKDYYFLDRPMLDDSMDLNQQRFQEREERYNQWADAKIELVENVNNLTDYQVQFFENLLLEKNNELNLDQWMITYNNDLNDLELKALKGGGVSRVEYRDDLCEFSKVPMNEDRLLSFRKEKPVSFPAGEFWDWPLEWGMEAESSILSLHIMDESLSKTIKNLPETDQIIKLALPINSFEELIEGHRWRMEKPQKRCFLPMSKNGRWSWYRLLHSQDSPINFLKMQQGSAFDQPSLMEVLNFDSNFKNFAAILGTPVNHSLTPSFHHDFFKKKKANVLRVDIAESEFDLAIHFLQELGLKWAAVTSPLKKKAAQLINSKDEAINTLMFKNDQWVGINTDPVGLDRLFQDLKTDKIAVWGGGGTLSSLESKDLNLSYYSSRTGQIKKGDIKVEPEALIWAVGRDNFQKQGLFPPKDWPIKVVFDLNYSQNSPGRLAAHRFSCQYVSGLTMFQGQALAQQEFWNEC